MEKNLPAIPAKRYFTIGEVGDLCGVKPHVLRYWEQEFTQLRPMKRRGNRRYYQHHEVLMIRRIRDLLYDQGFTINGARHKLQEISQRERGSGSEGEAVFEGGSVVESDESTSSESNQNAAHVCGAVPEQISLVMKELREIRELLTVSP